MTIAKQGKQVILLYASSIVGLLAGVLASVINTRALPPESYGDVRYVQNIISFISSLLLFGYFVSGSRLLAISKDTARSGQLRGAMCMILAGCIIVQMISMLAISVYYYICQKEIASLFLASVPVCGNVIMLNYLNTVSQGDNHIGRIALARFLPSTLYCVAAYFLFKYFGTDSITMLLLFNGIAVVTLGSIIVSTKPEFSNLGEAFSELKSENREYGFDVYVGSLVDVSTGYLSGITLGWFCETNAEVGFYTLALTMAAPISLLPSIVGTTNFKNFAVQNKIGKKVFNYSVILTVTSLVVFCLAIKYVVNFLYPDSYLQVSRYASLLAVGTAMHGFADMINRFLGAHGQGKLLRQCAFISGSVTLVGSLLFVYLWGITGAIVTRISSSFICLLTMIFYYIAFINQEEKLHPQE